MEDKKTEQNSDRRDFIKTMGYVTPAILTLAASPAMANTGSGGSGPTPDPS